ncbi:hypothetical protein B0H19DRAFT_1167612 [Mycena capillaripes]|nr:hypothetical protein B0H19DRAFT_1167612 [Mycena capillaripes]
MGRRTVDWSQLERWTGYRTLTNSWLGCFQSLSWWHNETVNIWSHLFGGLASDSLLLGVFLLGAFACFSCSAVFPSSLSHSERVAKYMNRVDYFGILALGTVDYFPTFRYAPAGIYLARSPTYSTPAYLRMRTYTFFACGVVAIIPFVHAIWRNGWDETNASISFGWIILEAVFYLVHSSERCPEYFWPGRFDLIGSSHQTFHVCSLLAVLSNYAGVREGFLYWHVQRGGVCV